jgi:transcriptional regulator with XRE-family HTH domain
MKKSIYSEEYGTFLQLLKEARENAGMTQEDLAAKLKATQSFVSKCERGERRLDIIELWQFCQAIEVSFSQFVLELDRQLLSHP